MNHEPVKTAMERFQAYRAKNGIPEKSSLAHIHKMSEFEEHERKELRAQNEALKQENKAMQISQKVLNGALQANSMSDSEWREKYMREVEGLNNEGDPIGGDSPSGLRHQVEALKQENIKIENKRDQLKQDFNDLQERFNGIKFIESELRKDNDSLNTQVAGLKNELLESLKDWHELNTNEERYKP